MLRVRPANQPDLLQYPKVMGKQVATDTEFRGQRIRGEVLQADQLHDPQAGGIAEGSEDPGALGPGLRVSYVRIH